MINGRTHHASGFVNEGVYVFGGQSFRMHNESSAEVWREDLWQEIAQPPVDGIARFSTVLNDEIFMTFPQNPYLLKYIVEENVY